LRIGSDARHYGFKTAANGNNSYFFLMAEGVPGPYANDTEWKAAGGIAGSLYQDANGIIHVGQ
jgi:hypothetical protein